MGITELVKSTQRITSVEIAELTGKLCKDVLRDVRSMEPAWVKTTGRNFTLSEYKDSRGRTLPCYALTKTECLYIATKFNDEARAKVVMRWGLLVCTFASPNDDKNFFLLTKENDYGSRWEGNDLGGGDGLGWLCQVWQRIGGAKSDGEEDVCPKSDGEEDCPKSDGEDCPKSDGEDCPKSDGDDWAKSDGEDCPKSDGRRIGRNRMGRIVRNRTGRRRVISWLINNNKKLKV